MLFQEDWIKLFYQFRVYKAFMALHIAHLCVKEQISSLSFIGYIYLVKLKKSHPSLSLEIQNLNY